MMYPQTPLSVPNEHQVTDTMTPDQQGLYQRLQDYSCDLPKAQFSFSQRLARENSWSLDYAQRVIEEYKKFAFLAVAAGHPVTPSDQVDQAWHLHLLYTHLYWDDFCPNVLRRSLHHGPTQGGGQEAQKFHCWYDRTLASYETFFGYPPPRDIWPPASIRFSLDIEGFQRINTTHHWVIPKRWGAINFESFNTFWNSGSMLIGNWSTSVLSPTHLRGLSWRQLLLFLVGSCSFLLMLSGPAIASAPSSMPILATFNPLNLNGPGFLAFYLVLLQITVGVTMWGQNQLRSHEAPPERAEAELNAYELAYLTGGPIRVATAAIASALEQGYCALSNHKLISKNPPSEDAHLLEHLVYSQVNSGRSLRQIYRTIRRRSDPIRQHLQDLGLSYSDAQLRTARLAVLPIFALLLLGLLKVYVGLARLRPPSVFLIVLCLVTLGLGCYFLGRAIPSNRATYWARERHRVRLPHSTAMKVAIWGIDQDSPQWGQVFQMGGEQRILQWHNLCFIASVIVAIPFFTPPLVVLYVLILIGYSRSPNRAPSECFPLSCLKLFRPTRRQGRSRWTRTSSSSTGYSGYIPSISDGSYSSSDCSDSYDSGSNSGSDCATSGCASSGCASSGCASSGCGSCGE